MGEFNRLEEFVKKKHETNQAEQQTLREARTRTICEVRSTCKERSKTRAALDPRALRWERDGSWAPRSGERGDCTDPPICPGDDEIGAGGGGEGADEDGGEEEEEEGGAAERRRRSRHLPAARSRRGVWLDRGRGA